MKTFKGKAIYQPAGKAKEYAEWACNFYVGCSNGCDYCYLKKGRGSAILGGNVPTLKKCFRDERHALEVFENELKANLPELQKHGLFFSFTTDPMLPETASICTYAAGIAVHNYGVPIKILTKCADWVDDFLHWIDHSNSDNAAREWRKRFAFGFTLTGHDELEKGASTNKERIESMRKLHYAGFKTFASIEPIIDFVSSYYMIRNTLGFCDLYKVGLLSGGKYDIVEAQTFVEHLSELHVMPKIYLKESLQKLTRYSPNELGDNFVTRDYNMFEQ